MNSKIKEFINLLGDTYDNLNEAEYIALTGKLDDLWFSMTEDESKIADKISMSAAEACDNKTEFLNYINTNFPSLLDV